MIEVVRSLRLIISSVCALVAFSSAAACTSTETGNPPVINMGLFKWSGWGAGDGTGGEAIAVRGDKGAVNPGGAVLEFKNQNTGETTEVRSNKDGSFEVTLSGQPGDTFTVVARNDAGRSKSVSFDAVPETDGGERDAGATDAERADASPNATDATDAAPPDATDAAPTDAGEPTEPVSDAGPSAGPDAGATTTAAGPDVPQPPLAATCIERFNDTVARLDQAVADADRTCADDSDCVLLEPLAETTCGRTCTSLSASLAGAASLEAVREAIETDSCEPFAENGCSAPNIECGTATGGTVCLRNQCMTLTDPGRTTVDCGALYDQATRRLEAALTGVDVSCVSAADCAYVERRTQCGGVCPSALVSSSAVQGVTEVIAQIDAEICAAGAPAGNCGLVVERCDPDPAPLCVAGTCVRP